MGSSGQNRLLQLVPPVIEGLPRQILNQIEAPGAQVSSSACRLHPATGFLKIPARVTAPQLLQDTVIKALATQADAVDASGDHSLQLLLIKARRIHFQGDFRPLLNAEATPQAVQQCCDLIRAQQGRSPPSDVDR